MKKNQILIIMIFSFIFVVAWVGLSIYHSIVTPTISEIQSIQIAPISPNFDTKTISDLKHRQNFTPIYQISVTSGNVSISATNPVLLTPIISSGSAQQATAGGSLSQ